MKKFFWGILLCAVLIGVGAGVIWERGKPAREHKKAMEEGQAIFTQNCAVCHGSDGRAQTPAGKQLGAMDLHSAEAQNKTDLELSQTIAYGHGNMPGFSGQLSSDQIQDVLMYVRELGKK